MLAWFFACVAADIPLDVPPADPAAPKPLPGDDVDDADPSDAVFDVDHIHRFELQMAPAAWLDVRDNPWAETWWEADATWVSGADAATEAVGTIGIRAFGAGSKIAGKPPLKLSFDRVVPGQDWRGLEQLKLDNSSQDFGFLNERIVTAALRGYDVPAARTGWAELWVNGDYAGFFVVMEPIDDRFLERWFGEADGPLYGMVSGYYSQGLNPLPVGYADPLLWFDNQTSVVGDGTELLAAAEALAIGDDAEVRAVVDLDQFQRVGIARSVMGGIDTFSGDGNNYYLYVHDGRLVQIPWDTDADLGYPYAFANAFLVDPTAPWVMSPWSVNPVTGAPYTDPVLLRHLAMGLDVQAVVDEVLAGPFDPDRVDADIVASAALIEAAVADDVLGYGGDRFEQRVADARLFVRQRADRLAGHEVSTCADLGAASTALADLSPTGTVGWGNLDLDGTQSWGPGLVVGGEHFCTGAFAHAPSRITLTLPAGTTRLVGAAGLHDWVQRCGDGATFEIWQGDARLWVSNLRQTYDPPTAFDLDVEPGAIDLITAPNGEYTCDTTSWLDVRAQ